MSQCDTTASPSLEQRKQQRQILQMMGITQWVCPHAPVVALADIAEQSDTEPTNILPTAPVNTDTPAHIHTTKDRHRQNSLSKNTDINETHEVSDGQEIIDSANSDYADYADDDFDRDSFDNDDFDSGDAFYDDFPQSDAISNSETADTIYHFDSLITDSSDQISETAATDSRFPRPIASVPTAASQQKVAAFDLQGGRYQSWVLLVDMRQLTPDTQALWQNITQALRISCENNAFPLCPNMDTAELANASVAGYVFRLGRQEHIKVAALTALPEGVSHPNLHSLPTLETMLTAPEQKRVFWQQLSDAAASL